MRKISIINQKGGVGKTTTTVNLATGLAKAGKKVLIIDLDPQGNISTCLNLSFSKDLFDLLITNASLDECIYKADENLYVLPSKETLTKAEMILVGEQNREKVLSRKLQEISGYDFVLLDCQPSLGLLNQNAMLYCDEVFIPVATDVLAVAGLRNMKEAVEKLNNIFNHTLRITKVIPTLYDGRSNVCKQALTIIREEFGKVTADPIKMNTKLKEAPKFGKSIFDYAKKSTGAKDYQLLVNSLLEPEIDLHKTVIAHHDVNGEEERTIIISG